MRIIRIGSRESELAVRQSRILIDSIKQYHNEIETELITMKTTGDIILDKSLDKIGGKGLFVKELDLALIEGRSDLSVHSLKDMPMETPEELPILAFSKREDPRDALVLPLGCTEIDPVLPIGCSSQRRMLQLKKIYPGANYKGIRGNVLTRLEKLDRGEYGALVLAAAGLKRLGLESRISRIFTTEEIIPAAGQGILAVQGRAGESYEFLKQFHNEEATFQAVCERAFVKTLNGGCSSPVAAYAKVEDEMITVTGLYFDEITGDYITGNLTGKKEDAEQLGEMLANKLRTEWCMR
ncbi:hydroxymethylbilane synthase [Lachnoclostridium phytofermentans]|uniref:Porphobilinogen deaminase n=1 Tax=Lachnoclostridium phytofermentans (strain ATCC 700394 / DSM 18823 / ISDg) TaxID=357809 RepID=A9KP83_LACP7|nr:porphobilinogen deaminase [Lachnoclostridium phytofermentans ISDg]